MPRPEPVADAHLPQGGFFDDVVRAAHDLGGGEEKKRSMARHFITIFSIAILQLFHVTIL